MFNIEVAIGALTESDCHQGIKVCGWYRRNGEGIRGVPKCSSVASGPHSSSPFQFTVMHDSFGVTLTVPARGLKDCNEESSD